jgi:hypothetical protein
LLGCSVPTALNQVRNHLLELVQCAAHPACISDQALFNNARCLGGIVLSIQVFSEPAQCAAFLNFMTCLSIQKRKDHYWIGCLAGSVVILLRLVPDPTPPAGAASCAHPPDVMESLFLSLQRPTNSPLTRPMQSTGSSLRIRLDGIRVSRNLATTSSSTEERGIGSRLPFVLPQPNEIAAERVAL